MGSICIPSINMLISPISKLSNFHRGSEVPTISRMEGEPYDLTCVTGLPLFTHCQPRSTAAALQGQDATESRSLKVKNVSCICSEIQIRSCFNGLLPDPHCAPPSRSMSAGPAALLLLTGRQTDRANMASTADVMSKAAFWLHTAGLDFRPEKSEGPKGNNGNGLLQFCRTRDAWRLMLCAVCAG